MKADLHSHTTYSDGFYSPTDLVKLAAKSGIEILSITDHDSVNGIAEANKAGEELGIEIIPGVEISTDIRDTEIHILAYFIDPANEELEHYLTFFRDERLKRAKRIVQKLNLLGLNITIEDVIAQTNNSAIGRPHIAQALIEKKQISSYYEAFNKYIGNNSPAYEKKVHLSPQSAFKIINDAGGLSFIAHPGNMPDVLVKELIEAGVDGIEVIHPSHSADKVKYYRGIVNQYYLLQCGGSDFHGGKREDEKNFGKYYIKGKIVEEMKTRLVRNTA